jgi:hypothetical protein
MAATYPPRTRDVPLTRAQIAHAIVAVFGLLIAVAPVAWMIWMVQE